MAKQKQTQNKATLETRTLTPEDAIQLLENNTINRPLSQPHVQRIASQIRNGHWKFNGDTIKISTDGGVLDGQHRLWACIEAKVPIETVVVDGIARDAFSTIDTVRRIRRGADVLALAGATRYRQSTSYALAWLIRYQRNAFPDYRNPKYRVENADIEEAYETHPGMIHAVERAQQLRTLANPAILAFIYYVLTNRNPDLAERMMNTLEDPASVSVNDPFFRLRSYLTTNHHRPKDPLMTIALAFKAANAAAKGEKLKHLLWRIQGKSPEEFPKLTVTQKRAA